MTSPESGSREPLLAEFDGSVCPACHHRAHDPGSCSECPRCELHTDEALAFVIRYEPELIESDAVERFAEALVRAVNDINDATECGDLDYVSRVSVLAAISALRSPADTGEHQEGDVGS